jgi:hypothetical protein
MKELTLEKLENLEAGKFWGKDCGPDIPLPGGTCIKMCTYRVFWAKLRPYEPEAC